MKEDLTENWFLKYLREYSICGKVQRFFQRLFRGWDDSETWSLDYTFYKWFYTRLKRYIKLANDDSSYYEELKNRLHQLELLVEYFDNEVDFPELDNYLNKNLKEYIGKETSDKKLLSSMAYNSCREDFNEWFGKNINLLWW